MRIFLSMIMALVASVALGNDSIVELGAGGLRLSRSDVIAMQREDLFISADEVRVDYVFRNHADEDVNALVAFPMPVIEGNPFEMISIPDPQVDNFLNFSVVVAGQAIAPSLQQRAFANGLDVTDDLNDLGVPLLPFGDLSVAALEQLTPDIIDGLANRGILYKEEYDDGSGWRSYPTPIWELHSTYWWRMTFPANSDIEVSHNYTPGVGATTALTFLNPDGGNSDWHDNYVDKYCMDAPFEDAVRRRLAASMDKGGFLWESRISYILVTGRNWAGPIGTFHLSVDKGSVNNLVSFCSEGIVKTGPTVFETTIENFYPERNLDILLVRVSD